VPNGDDDDDDGDDDDEDDDDDDNDEQLEMRATEFCLISNRRIVQKLIYL
jgi:hypothetical protein